MFSFPAYFLTDHPNEVDRFMGSCVILVTIAYTSQALGYLIGSIFHITNGSIVGSAVLIPLIMISLHGLDYNSKINPFYSFLMTLLFIRNGIVGLCNILSYKRGPLECKESFCIYVQMDNFMKHLSIPVIDYRHQFGIILIFMIVFRIMGYLSLKCRLNIELVTKLSYYVKKIRIFK
ncbi:hypothetical protein BDFB_013600 [Asbolus verrucosus]|uniref:ABC2 membrane domain containing protein n=1 Tax=Asbolus verrucosus TaxID=1661398 RepID=A0A482VPY4_ASBVE|nr:hypothetical protein BDFB_013600 [Asbolus verrucosus]